MCVCLDKTEQLSSLENYGSVALNFISSPLILLAAPTNITVMKSIDGPVLEGTNITLTCAVDGNLTSKSFLWYKDDTLIENGNQEQLVLKDIARRHAGYYHCGVQHALPPTFYSDVVEVIVHCKYSASVSIICF